MKRVVKSSIAQLRAAESLAEAIPVLKHAGELLGLPMVSVNGDYSSNDMLRDTGGRSLAETFGWSVDVLTGWRDEELTPFSPVGAACRLAHRPFAWRPTTLVAPSQGRIETPQERILDFLDLLGVTGGITTPVRMPFGRVGSVTWFSYDPRFNLEKVLGEHEDSFLLLGHYFMDIVNRYDTLDEAAGIMASLSRREIECLTWVALGKTDGEIAAIIGRSPSTARFHVDRAVDKLNAISRTQAVAKAAQLGLLATVV
jgi:DNA-binding CsgD family transcriptional regulator